MRLGLFKCHSGITVTLAYTFRKSVLTCDVILPVSQLPTVLGVGKRHPLISNVTLGLAPELTKRLLSFVFFTATQMANTFLWTRVVNFYIRCTTTLWFPCALAPHAENSLSGDPVYLFAIPFYPFLTFSCFLLSFHFSYIT